MEGVVALRRFRAPVVHKKGGCWLQVSGGCSSQVQINVKCLGGFPGWLLLTGGCSSQVVARAGWTVHSNNININTKHVYRHTSIYHQKVMFKMKLYIYQPIVKHHIGLQT